jgi:hypothetical protein
VTVLSDLTELLSGDTRACVRQASIAVSTADVSRNVPERRFAANGDN